MAKNGATGKITQVIGPVVDAAFAQEDLPDIYDALEIPLDDGGTLVCEVQGPVGRQVGCARWPCPAPTACAAA